MGRHKQYVQYMCVKTQGEKIWVCKTETLCVLATGTHFGSGSLEMIIYTTCMHVCLKPS